jgi:hypothetical protein
MGGRGSGGHNSKGKLRDVQCARLDVHELARNGKLKLGTRGQLFGTILFEVTGGPDARQLVLDFPWKSASGETLDPVKQIICGHWRKAHFGGRHLLFVCPGCNREARVLFARYANDRIWFFRCRKCAGITYQSTMGHRWDRARRAVSRSCALGSNGERAALCRSSREVCMSGRTSLSWGCLPITRRCERRGRATPENTDRISIMLICGDSAEIDSQT